MSIAKNLNAVKVSRCIGLAGMFITILGVIQTDLWLQKSCFLTGAILLCITAHIERHRLFFWLEVVIVIGTLMAFTNTSDATKASIPIIFGAIIFLMLYKQKAFTPAYQWLGGIGLLMLAVGFAIVHPLVYLAGGIILTLYSWKDYQKGASIALIWLILNLVFSVLAFINLMEKI